MILTFQVVLSQNKEKVFFTTGYKVGEVTASSAVVLVRLCKDSVPVAVYHQRRKKVFRTPFDFDENMPINKMDGAVLGTSGQVKIELITKGITVAVPWKKVSVNKDYILKHKLKELKSNTTYKIRILGRKKEGTVVTTIEGTFKTAPLKTDIVPVFFTTSTCQYFWSYDDNNRGFKIYDSMKKMKPSFYCQTGDYVYYDKPGPIAVNVELARHKWHAMDAWPSLKSFYLTTSIYQQKDDHDLLRDDASPYSKPLGSLTYKKGLSIWREQVAVVGKPYRTFRWGKDVQIWLVEGREYRSPNKSIDSKQKTIWGEKQIKWFKETVEASDATFKILISPTPIVGPDRIKGKYDNHSNMSFATEGIWLRKYLADNKLFVINGDRHWQYVSVDAKTGLWEFSQGPVSNFHAQGWKPKDKRPEHKFLRVKGGFLGVKVYREKDKPNIEFIHYNVDGNVVNKEVF